MHIRTIIVAAVASLSFAGTGLGDWGPLPVNLSNELTAPDSGNFGSSVAIDGDTCVIGAQGTNSETGSAYVFTNIGGTWNQVAELTATDAARYDLFGSSVAIDGSTCVIGAPGTNSYSGSAYIFTNTGGTWSQVAELTATDATSEDQFGISVAIDGDTCVIGSAGTNSETGSAFVFTKSGGTWSQVAELTASDAASGDAFGISVAIDGDTCVIGALGTNSYTGSAYVFTKSGGTWSQAAKLTEPDGFSYDQFGIGVAIDGDTCVIGATDTIFSSGSAYLFTKSGGTWGQVAELISGDYEGNYGSVTIDGDTCVIGAPVTNSYTGSAYFFSSSTSTAATGACCVTIGCTVIAESACTDLGGTWTEAGTCADCPASCSSDSDNDGDVDVDDILNLLSSFGACP